MARTSDIKTKQTKKNILFQAFLLYSKMLYKDVTFDELEKVTNLSRGALLHHVKTKENLFKMVVENSLTDRSSVIEIPLKEKDCLKHFIQDFIEKCQDVVKTMKSLGIKNINLAFYNIECNAINHYEGYGKVAMQMHNVEIKGWTNAIKKAIQNREVKSDIDPELFARLFLNAYLGHAYTSAKEENGCDINLLNNELMTLYKAIKV